MEFVAIDFETANEQRASACAVGVCIYEPGQPPRTYSTLIRPREVRFNGINVQIHGITAADVRQAPEFPDVWRELLPLLAGRVVLAHNASFDMSVIRHSLNLYGLRYPALAYNCTVQIARGAWCDLPQYRLSDVASHLGITFKHHDALEDANCCAQIASRACQTKGCQSIDELAERLQLQHGRILDDGGYVAPRKVRSRRRMGPLSRPA